MHTNVSLILIPMYLLGLVTAFGPCIRDKYTCASVGKSMSVIVCPTRDVWLNFQPITALQSIRRCEQQERGGPTALPQNGAHAQVG